MGLADYAEKQKIEPGACWVCRLPPEIRKEVEEGITKGLGATVIASWLRDEKGYTRAEANERRIRYHRDLHLE